MAQLIPIRCFVDPHGAQRRDDLALHRQTCVRGIVGGLERALIRALEAVVLSAAHRDVEGLARHVLQATTAGVIEFRPAQRLAVAAAMTDAEPAILPEFTFRAEPLRRMNVGAEATSTDGTNAGRSTKQLDLRKGLGRA